MSTRETTQPSTWAYESRAWIERLRDRLIWFVLVGLFVACLVIADSPGLFPRPFQSMALALTVFALAFVVGLMYAWQRSIAAWTLAVGCVAIPLLAVTWGGLLEAIWLLTLSVGLTMVLVGTVPGAIAAGCCTLFLVFASPAVLPVPATGRSVAIAGMWGIAGMIGLTLHSLLQALQWAWSHYEREHDTLEQTRDYQVQLHETMDDLNFANVQLTRMNQLTQSLRQIAEDERSAKEQFVANVSHELRTPLNMIVGFCEMITESPGTYGEEIPLTLLSDLNVVLRNSQHLSRLIDDVLDLSQIEAGQMALTKERVSLEGLVESAAIATRPLFESKDLHLETKVEENLPPVFCDRTRIREVLLNLLSNAGRFTERGGVQVRARREEGDILVSVADTGPGIAEEDQDRIFQPFQQLDGTIRRRYGGTGLGLSISRSFVELHGGEMWIESKQGRGTTIYFRFPIDPPAALDDGALRWFNPYDTYEERARPFRLQPAVVRPRFVVVESGNAMQRLLSRYLDDVEIVPADSLEKAAKELSQTPAQAVLINDTNVGDALSRLDEKVPLPIGVPAIVCSLPGIEQATNALGVSGYLVKPISRESLLSSIDRLGRKVKTVLVVDDEPDALQLFWRMLSLAGRGYQVLRAYDGRQALDLLEHQRPDVILLDLVMPEVDGFEFLAIKSQKPAWRDIPTILISARDPLGHPVVSKYLAVTCAGGLSARKLLDCIRSLNAIIGGPSAGSTLQGALPG